MALKVTMCIMESDTSDTNALKGSLTIVIINMLEAMVKANVTKQPYPKPSCTVSSCSGVLLRIVM